MFQRRGCGALTIHVPFSMAMASCGLHEKIMHRHDNSRAEHVMHFGDDENTYKGRRLQAYRIYLHDYMFFHSFKSYSVEFFGNNYFSRKFNILRHYLWDVFFGESYAHCITQYHIFSRSMNDNIKVLWVMSICALFF
jgi:hypothetical protein